MPERPPDSGEQEGTAVSDARRLYGSWRLVSWDIQITGEESFAASERFGTHPFGRLILTPEHCMMAYVSKPDRKVAAGDHETAELLRTMIAYTGKFRIEGDKFITDVDGAWNEIYRGQQQVRHFAFDDEDTLVIQVVEQPSAFFPRQRITGTIRWRREK
jgi:lipocalin-like protein